ncbi:MAG TPA: VanZ family protein [Pirellulaceae bacterium]|nr:VanZ family protein [Pirellulaceae bacterium]
MPRAIAVLAAYWSFLFILTHIPLKSMAKIEFSDKLAHALVYGGLAILMRWVIYVWRRTSLKQYALIVFICAIYATIDEQLQRFVPSRSCDLNDWIADMIGVIASLTACAIGERSGREP